MLEAFAAEFVAQGEEEIVMVVMVGAEEAVGLLDDGAVVGELGWGDGELGGLVGDDVEMDGHFGAGIEVEALEVAARDQWGIRGGR